MVISRSAGTTPIIGLILLLLLLVILVLLIITVVLVSIILVAIGGWNGPSFGWKGPSFGWNGRGFLARGRAFGSTRGFGRRMVWLRARGGMGCGGVWFDRRRPGPRII
jgi:hypothetical protein